MGTNAITTQESEYYGLLHSRNINRVRLGDIEFDTWYGNAAYFHTTNHSELGYLLHNRPPKDPAWKKKGNPLQYWLEMLYVCEFCFKYTDKSDIMCAHRLQCRYHTRRPTVGRLVYRDDQQDLVIREVRGFQDTLFCQNLSLFGKLFLDDKSVYYNIDHFNFYVVYGKNDDEFLPMGFFSKEILSYDNDNNLACICIFPPFQRRRLGSLLIEFSYELAKRTPGQSRSGPEFPLSPYGKITYLSFWSKLLCHVIDRYLRAAHAFTLEDVASITGYRREDILFTLEYMRVLVEKNGLVTLLLGNLKVWCDENHFTPKMYKKAIKEECLLI